MKTVGSYEMKTKFAQYLKDVTSGESLVITLHGVPVAKVSPVGAPDKSDQLNALEELKVMRAKHPIDKNTMREWIDQGRR